MRRNYGQEKKYYHKCKGTNSRLDTIQAAILNIKLGYLEENNTKRYKAAQLYKDMLKDTGDVDFQKEEKYGNHIYHLFIITTTYRDALMKHLQSKGIQCGIHYPIPIHLQEAYKDLNYSKGAFPNAEHLADRMLSLPMHPYLKAEEIEYIVDAVKEFFG
jgi:dTDP-4-amino-4,6-dideoxygalactose transaminase